MYTDEEYKKRSEELGIVAMDLIMNQFPEDAIDAASKMISEDAYILGVHVGTILQVIENNDLREELAGKDNIQFE